MNMMKKTVIASGIALALGASGAFASEVQNIFGAYTYSTNYANFTMLSGAGYIVGGTNNVNMTWDGNAFNASSDYTGTSSVSNVTASSTTPFFGYTWSAHNIQVFVPGSYSFDTALDGGNGESGIMNVTVPTGDIGMHMLFNWNGNNNIDVFVVAAPNSMFGSGAISTASTCTGNATTPVKNCLYGGPTKVTGHAPTANETWMLATVDGNGDGIMGIPMAAGGPFAGFNAGFNATMTPTAKTSVTPIPAAAWLFGSGLIGLVGIGRRKKA